MNRESYERGQRALIIASGFEAIPSPFDKEGNCKTCGECLCPFVTVFPLLENIDGDLDLSSSVSFPVRK